MNYYSTGTVAVTNGSPNIVGTGTVWLSAGIKDGTALLIENGDRLDLVPIQSVTGDGAIVAQRNYLGPSDSGLSYSVVPVQGFQMAAANALASALDAFSPWTTLAPNSGDYLQFLGTAPDIVPSTRSALQVNTDLSNNLSEVNVAAASTTDIGAAASPRVQITGTGVTINSLGTAKNCLRWLRFAGVNTVINSATLAIPGGVARVTSAGATAAYISDGSSPPVWREVFYHDAAQASDIFEKADMDSVAFTKTSAGTISVKAGTRIGLAGNIFSFASATAVTMPSLAAGTDYAIFMCTDGTIRADANFSAPSGYTTSNSRKIGGFHYAPGGNASGTSGGDTTPAINAYSIWDLKWRPACPDPRGMALIANGFWCDIYLCNTAPEANGTSGYNLTIADGSSPPKIPTGFGGNGSTAYGEFNWWEAFEVMSAAGKQLLSYADFAAAMYGTTEASSFGTDPDSTILRNAYTSKWGIMLATGNMWVWGRDLNYYLAGGAIATDEAFSWHDNVGGRGQIYSQGTYGISAAIFGGSWSFGAYSGSRTSHWSVCPWDSYSFVGARGRCDHLRLA